MRSRRSGLSWARDRPPRLQHAWVVLGLGCGTTDKTAVPPDASATTEDSSGADAADSGDTGSDPPAREGLSISVRVAGDIPRVAVDVHTVVLGSSPDAYYQIAVGPTAAGTAALDIPAPEDAWLQDLPDGSRGFVALPFAFIDDDADGAHTLEEQYLGVGEVGLVYIEGTPGTELAAAGFGNGWSVADVTLESGAFTLSATAPTELVLDPQLIPQDRLLLEATLDGPPDGRRVALLPETVIDGTVTGPIVYDAPASGVVQVPLDGPPPDSHLQDQGADGTQYRDWRYAVEHLTVYRDVDGSGGWSAGDTVDAVACAQGVAAPLQHSTEPDKAFEALYLATYDILPAWSVWLDLPDGPIYQRADEVGPITLSGACLP